MPKFDLTLRFVVTCALLCACLTMGGGTHAGFLADAILQALAVLVLAALTWSPASPAVPLSPSTPARASGGWCGRVLLALALLVLALPVLQALPLPPAIVDHLSRPALDAEIRALVHAPAGWRAISRTPASTLLVALAGLPALAVLIGVIRLGRRERQLLTLVVLAVGLASVLLGLLQVAQGPRSPLRLYPFTNASEAVGFFANRNHFAALIYVLLVLAGAWASLAVQRWSAAPRARQTEGAGILAMVASVTVIAVLVGAQMFTRSRAGIGITGLALVAAGGLAMMGQPRGGTPLASRLILAASVAGILFTMQFGLYRMMERFHDDPLKDARLPFTRNTAQAAAANLPLGAGMGSFVPVYGVFEKASDGLVDTFANRAHNDILEFWLEAGVPGACLGAAFVVWMAAAAWQVGRRRTFAPGFDRRLAQSALLVIVFLLIHSFFDYPLRTAALSAVFAMACALLVPPFDALAPGLHEAAAPRPAAKTRVATAPRPFAGATMAGRPAQPSSQPSPMPTRSPTPRAPGAPAPAPGRPAAVGERWGAGVAWPSEWQALPSKPASPREAAPGQGAARRTTPTDEGG